MRNSICLIAGAGEFYAKNFKAPRPGGLVIAADGGLKWLIQAGIPPDIVIGDFDSIKGALPNDFSAEIITLPKEKDETDMRRAITEGYDRGFRVFHIHGGTGGRIDHTAANVQNVVHLSRSRALGILFDDDYFITALSDGETEIKGTKGEYISVFAYGGCARGVTLKGLRYELSNAVLYDDNPIGTSNEFAEQAAKISVKSGTLLITCPCSAEIN